MRVERIYPADDERQLRLCYDLVLSGQPEDDPAAPASYRLFRSWWTRGFSGEPRQVWLASSESGTPLGCYLIDFPSRENRQTCFVSPHVALTARRRGVGAALVAHAAGQAAAEGRSLLMSGSRVDSPGEAFAAAIGARPGLVEARRVLAAGEALRARLPALRAAALQYSVGYELIRWAGATPDDLVAGVCAVNNAMEDAPHDASYEPLRWDADRVRTIDEVAAWRGTREYSVAARHTASGQMAALTQVSLDPDLADWAFQGLTAVTRPHRGHRLGLLVKVAMLEWLAEREPQVRQIMTFNAAQNEHMISVNAQLGHRVTATFRAFELETAAAAKPDR